MTPRSPGPVPAASSADTSIPRRRRWQRGLGVVPEAAVRREELAADPPAARAEWGRGPCRLRLPEAQDARQGGTGFPSRPSPPCSPLTSSCQVPSSGLRGARPHQRQVRLSPKRVRLPAGRAAAKGGLRQRPLVLLEVAQERGAHLPHPGLRRLGPRQRELPHPPEVTGPGAVGRGLGRLSLL